MKRFLKQTLQTDEIEQLKIEDIKRVCEGDNMISRIKYRRQVGNAMSGSKRPAIAKNEIFRHENMHSEFMDEK